MRGEGRLGWRDKLSTAYGGDERTRSTCIYAVLCLVLLLLLQSCLGVLEERIRTIGIGIGETLLVLDAVTSGIPAGLFTLITPFDLAYHNSISHTPNRVRH